MKKLMVMVAMLAMVLATAVPAFAQDTDVVGDENVVTTEGDDTQFNAVAQNIIGSFGDITQTQFGHADAIATDESSATAEVSQSQHFTIVQFNSALNDF